MPVIEAYLAGPEELRAAIDGLSRVQLVSRPVPGKWSILEVVCHLADTDANIAHRIKRVLSEERPSFERVRPDLMHAAAGVRTRGRPMRSSPQRRYPDDLHRSRSP